MATYTVSNRRQIAAVSSSGDTIKLVDAKQYTIKHTGKTTAGGASTALLVLGNDNEPGAVSYAAENDKAPLAAGESMSVGFGPQTLYMKSDGDTVALLVIPHNLT